MNTNFSLNMPKGKYKNVIKVIGVGGGGSNAVNHMFKQGILGVDFVVANTDMQHLENCTVPDKIQLGTNLTEGMGAGANPEIGEKAAIENIKDIEKILAQNTKMIFITAGMGGGTGTGAAPIFAKMARERGILTIGIVTMPFEHEGKIRGEQARKGLEKIKNHLDSLIIINNNKIREVYGNLGYSAGFGKADEVLTNAAKGIAEVITKNFAQNIDLKDVNTVLKNSGTAIMGSAKANGENRSRQVIMQALDSPLLNDNRIKGCKNVLLLISYGTDEITIDEISEINEFIQNEANNEANIIMGIGEDLELNDSISVTVIATGFHIDKQGTISEIEEKKIFHNLEDKEVSIIEHVRQEVNESKFDKQNIIKHELNLEGEKDENDIQIDNNASNEKANIYEFGTKVKKEVTENVEMKNNSEPFTKSIKKKKNPLDYTHNLFSDQNKIEETNTLKKIGAQMKQFNSSKVEDLEKPAYERNGIILEEPKKEGNLSRYTLNEDYTGNEKLRTNNSFLHDNVD